MGHMTGLGRPFGHINACLSLQQWEAAEGFQPGRGISNLRSAKLLFQEALLDTLVWIKVLLLSSLHVPSSQHLTHHITTVLSIDCQRLQVGA